MNKTQSLCGQEFGVVREHGAGSYYNGKRLNGHNGHCPGDIRRRSQTVRRNKVKTARRGPELVFTGEPHRF